MGVRTLLLLLLLPQSACGTAEAECPKGLVDDLLSTVDFYRPGDQLISGVISAMTPQLIVDHFFKPPTFEYSG